jgi:hypothetical protein
MNGCRNLARLAAVVALALLPGLAYAAAAAPDLAGIYWATTYSAKIQVVGGGEPPLTAAGKAAYDRNIAGLKDKSVIDIARKWCLPDGVPHVLATPYPFEIVQGPPGQVLILHELNHQIRRVALDRPLPTYEDLVAEPWYNGHSVGHYEGDTLVVETRGFNDRTFMDGTGLPHTDELVTTERYRRLSPTQLEVVVTIHDPMYFTRDWQARFVYAKREDVRIEDYVCGEKHRDISSVRGVRPAPQ